MDKIGIDVHKVATQVCILTETGEYEECRIRTERDVLTAFFGERAKARIVLEVATESEWVARHLESLRHEVIVADPNFAPMYASRSRKVKTDKRDARALCDACHLGAFRPSHRSSDESRLLRKHLRVREVLVQTRSRMISLCRSLLRQEGMRVPSGGAPSFAKRVRTLELPEELRAAIEPLLKSHENVCVQIELVDKTVEQAVKDDERVQRLTTVPSVGPVTAVTFIALVDDVGRFESSHKLQSYVGLVPREYSSGEKQQRGHITKTGNRSRHKRYPVEVSVVDITYFSRNVRLACPPGPCGGSNGVKKSESQSCEHYESDESQHALDRRAPTGHLYLAGIPDISTLLRHGAASASGPSGGFGRQGRAGRRSL